MPVVRIGFIRCGKCESVVWGNAIRKIADDGRDSDHDLFDALMSSLKVSWGCRLCGVELRRLGMLRNLRKYSRARVWDFVSRDSRKNSLAEVVSDTSERIGGCEMPRSNRPEGRNDEASGSDVAGVPLKLLWKLLAQGPEHAWLWWEKHLAAEFEPIANHFFTRRGYPDTFPCLAGDKSCWFRVRQVEGAAGLHYRLYCDRRFRAGNELATHMCQDDLLTPRRAERLVFDLGLLFAKLAEALDAALDIRIVGTKEVATWSLGAVSLDREVMPAYITVANERQTVHDALEYISVDCDSSFAWLCPGSNLWSRATLDALAGDRPGAVLLPLDEISSLAHDGSLVLKPGPLDKYRAKVRSKKARPPAKRKANVGPAHAAKKEYAANFHEFLREKVRRKSAQRPGARLADIVRWVVAEYDALKPGDKFPGRPSVTEITVRRAIANATKK